ncbi:MAG: L,D-transpeptidase family protein [Bacteroidota bacterium]
MITDKNIFPKKQPVPVLPLLAALFFLFSCGENKPEHIAEDKLEDSEKQKMVTDDIRLLLEGNTNEGILKIDSMVLFPGEELVALYEKNEFTPYWSENGKMNQQSTLMLSALDSAWYYGFDPEWYFQSAIIKQLSSAEKDENFVTKSKSLATADILLTNAYMMHAVHLAKGFIDTSGMMRKAWKVDSVKIDFHQCITTEEKDFLKILYSFQPANIEYRQLQFALSKFVRTNELWKDEFEIPESKKDSVGYWTMAKEVLLKMKYLDTATVKVDSMVTKAYVKFQELHAIDPDAKAGRHSRSSLSKSNYERFLQAALALEKWRWKKLTAELFFRVNIPSYELIITRNDSILRKHRVITGAPDTKTPEFSAKIKWITLHPYWHLPHSISSTEFLWAAQRDSTYVRRNGYNVFNIDKSQATTSEINWKKYSQNYFPFKVRQNGGYGNSLGLIVFHFPNKYDVYMHDTPTKYLFKRSVRAFSHGCMRLENPFSLGEFVMKNDRPKDTINADTLKNWALRGYEQRLVLKKQIPINVDYITTTADSAGNIFFHLDIYGRDEKYMELLKAMDR